MFTDPPLIPVVPLTVTDVSAVPPPTAPPSTALPVIPKVWLAPLPTVLVKVTVLPTTVVAALKVTAPVNVTVPGVVTAGAAPIVIVGAVTATLPLPVIVCPPLTVTAPPAPLDWIVTGLLKVTELDVISAVPAAYPMVMPVHVFAIAATSAAVICSVPAAPAIPIVVDTRAGSMMSVLFVLSELPPPFSNSVLAPRAIEPKGIAPLPTFPPADMVPAPALTLSVQPAAFPIISVVKVIAFPARTRFAPAVTVPVYVCSPLVLMKPTFVAVVPLTVTEVSAVRAPTFPPNTALPVTASVRLTALLSVPLKVTVVPVRVVLAPRVALPV